MSRTPVSPAGFLLLGLALALAGCASPGLNVTTAASSSAFTIDPRTSPVGRVAARDSQGRDWYVTVLQSYYAASEQVCMSTMIVPAAMPTALPTSSVLCRTGDGWRVVAPLRSDGREGTTALPDRLTL